MFVVRIEYTYASNMLLTHHMFVTVIVHNFVHHFPLDFLYTIYCAIKLAVRNDGKSVVVLKNTFLFKSLTKLLLTKLCISTNKNSAFAFLNLVYVIKDMILNEHCHYSTLYRKYVLYEINIRI
jgi:hypothetical protein